MERIKLGKDLEISRIVHGFWRLNEWGMSKEEILDFIKTNISKGLTTFDHADIYGDYEVEEKFGEVLNMDPSLRDKMEIVTKCGIKLPSKNRPENTIHSYDTSSDHIIKSAERSLKNLNTDYIDLLLIHRPDPLMNPVEVGKAFNKLKKEGKVKEFGVSNFLPHQFNMLESYLDIPLVTNQVEISVMELEQFENGVVDNCLQKRISPMAWSPLGGGAIFNGDSKKIKRLRKVLKKVASNHGIQAIDRIIYAWLLKHPAKIIPIIGTGKSGRVDNAIDALDINLTKEEWFEIYVASRGNDIA